MKCSELFRIEIDWTVQQDHAGVGLELALLGYEIAFNLHDSRHWNITENRWYRHDEAGYH